jgi:hypothetical protein
MERSIRKYLTQDLNELEKYSYFKYVIEHKTDNTDWIEKTNRRRDILLEKDLICDVIEDNTVCGSWININEKGKCTCSNNHSCSEIIYNSIIQ